MTNPDVRKPKVSNRISPLALIVVVILAAMVLAAVVQMRGHHTTASGVHVTEAQPLSAATMPKQSSEPDTPQAGAHTNDAVEAKSTSAANEVGGLTAHSGPANTAGR